MLKSTQRLSALLTILAFTVTACGGSNDNSSPMAGDLVSSSTYSAPASIAANTTLLVHYMPAVNGALTQASTLLFVPKGTPPAGGWPVVAWIHGTTTNGQKTCAPSLSPDLDGGLTADGFVSHYVELVASFVGDGYAVVAPDLEGLGTVATEAYPYYNGASTARSAIAGVRAARHANSQLSSAWAVVGHSDGGRGSLSVEKYAAEAPELTLKGTVAYAPFLSIAASVAQLTQRASSDPANAAAYLAEANHFVASLTAGLLAITPNTDLAPIMGADLQGLMPSYKSKCVFKTYADVAQAVAAKAPGAFAGLKAGWDTSPAMGPFLAANDLATTQGFTVHLPTLIVQGTADVFVFEPLDAAFAAKLISAGAPVTYRVFSGADHSSIVPLATPTVLTFLANRLK